MRKHKLDIETVTVESFLTSPLGAVRFSTYIVAYDSRDAACTTQAGFGDSGVSTTCGASCGLDGECPP
jgi:hypothetical protein